MTPSSETLCKVAIDAGQPETIIKRKQYESDDNITCKEAQAHLYVSHAVLMHPAWHADKAHATDACAYHSKGNKQPRRLPACTEERVVVALGVHKPGEEDEKEYIKT